MERMLRELIVFYFMAHVRINSPIPCTRTHSHTLAQPAVIFPLQNQNKSAAQPHTHISGKTAFALSAMAACVRIFDRASLPTPHFKAITGSFDLVFFCALRSCVCSLIRLRVANLMEKYTIFLARHHHHHCAIDAHCAATLMRARDCNASSTHEIDDNASVHIPFDVRICILIKPNITSGKKAIMVNTQTICDASDVGTALARCRPKLSRTEVSHNKF